MVGPKYVVTVSKQEIIQKHKNLTQIHTNEITHALMQIKYESRKRVGGGFAAAHPVGDRYGICRSAWVTWGVGVQVSRFVV